MVDKRDAGRYGTRKRLMADTTSVVRRADESGIPLLLVRIVLGGLFIYMGVNKIGDPVDFLKLIRSYEMAPETPPYFLNGIAVILPWLEVVCGIALVLGLWVRGAAALIAAMLCVFTPVVLVRALQIHSAEGTPFFKIAFDCGCGAGVEIIWIKVLKNTGLLILSVLAILSRSRRFSLTALINRRSAVAATRRPGISTACSTDEQGGDTRDLAAVAAGTTDRT